MAVNVMKARVMAKAKRSLYAGKLNCSENVPNDFQTKEVPNDDHDTAYEKIF